MSFVPQKRLSLYVTNDLLVKTAATMIKVTAFLVASLWLVASMADPRLQYSAKHSQGLGENGIGTERAAAGSVSDQVGALIEQQMGVWSGGRYQAGRNQRLPNLIVVRPVDGTLPAASKREALDIIQDMRNIINANARK